MTLTEILELLVDYGGKISGDDFTKKYPAFGAAKREYAKANGVSIGTGAYFAIRQMIEAAVAREFRLRKAEIAEVNRCNALLLEEDTRLRLRAAKAEADLDTIMGIAGNEPTETYEVASGLLDRIHGIAERALMRANGASSETAEVGVGQGAVDAARPELCPQCHGVGYFGHPSEGLYCKACRGSGIAGGAA